MINGKKVFSIIPARSGSKGLPNKNILDLLDKPLIAWSIEHAKKSKYIDSCVVSTESEEIKTKAIKYGGKVNSLRPNELSTDIASTNSVVEYEINSLDEEFDIVLLLQPTSPLRLSTDIDKALELMIDKGASSVVSAVKTNHPPEWTFKLNSQNKIEDSDKLNKFKRRQDIKKSYQLNGSIYATNIDDFINDNLFIRSDTVVLIMPQERSIDIDNLYDFNIAEKLLSNRFND